MRRPAGGAVRLRRGARPGVSRQVSRLRQKSDKIHGCFGGAAGSAGIADVGAWKMDGWRDLIEISSAVGTGNVLPWITEARRSHSVPEVLAPGAVASLFALAAFLSTGARPAGPPRAHSLLPQL